VAECDKFFRQVGNNPFGAAVKTRRNALYERSHLCNFHDHIYFPPALHNPGSATKFHFRPIGSLTRSSNELITASQLGEKDISPYFWPNGTMPKSPEYDTLVAEGFKSFVLRVGGLVESPRAFTYAELKAMPKQEQITTHFCIQGWSGVAKWGGVPMRHILELVRPTPEARCRLLLIRRWWRGWALL
jgi:Oxidoreductase molybdopterin binding domain